MLLPYPWPHLGPDLTGTLTPQSPLSQSIDQSCISSIVLGVS